MKLGRVALIGTLWGILQIAVERLWQALTFFIVAKLLGPADFGLAAMAVAPSAVAAGFVQGAMQGVVQRAKGEVAYHDAAFWGVLGAASLSAAIIVGLGAVAGSLAGHPLVGYLMMASAVTPVIVAIGVVPEAMLTREFRFKSLALRKTIGNLISGAVCVAIAAMGGGAWSLVIQGALAAAIASLIAAGAARWAPTRVVTVREAWAGFKGVWAVMGAGGLSQANSRVSDLVVGLFAGAAGAGYFRLGRTLLDLVTSVTFNPLANVMVPVFARMAGDNERLEKAARQLLTVAFICFSMAIIGAFGTGPVLPILMGRQWDEIPTVLNVVLLALPGHAVILTAQPMLVALRREGLLVKFNVAQFAGNLLFVSAGALLGPLPAVIAFSGRTYVFAAIMMSQITRIIGRPNAKNVAQLVMPLIILGPIASLTLVAGSFVTSPIARVAFTAIALSVYVGSACWFCRHLLGEMRALLKSR